MPTSLEDQILKQLAVRQPFPTPRDEHALWQAALSLERKGLIRRTGKPVQHPGGHVVLLWERVPAAASFRARVEARYRVEAGLWEDAKGLARTATQKLLLSTVGLGLLSSMAQGHDFNKAEVQKLVKLHNDLAAQHDLDVHTTGKFQPTPDGQGYRVVLQFLDADREGVQIVIQHHHELGDDMEMKGTKDPGYAAREMAQSWYDVYQKRIIDQMGK